MQFGNKRNIVDKSSLKKQIVNENKKLEESNKKLSLSIIDKKKELKSLDVEVKSAKKDKDSILDSVRKDKEFSSLLKEKINSLSQDKLVANNLVKEAKSEAKAFNRMTSDAERKLTAAEKRLEALEKKGSEFKGIYAQIKKSKLEAKEIESHNEAAKKAIFDMNSEWESDRDSKENELERVMHRLSDSAKKLTKQVASLTEERSVLDHELEILQKQHSQEKIKFNEYASKNMNELNDLHLDSMVKVKNEVDKLKYLSNETTKKSKELEEENIKLDKVKDSHVKAVNKFDQWKINAVDEVARMKNKGKLDNIDKAGLSDVLNK